MAQTKVTLIRTIKTKLGVKVTREVFTNKTVSQVKSIAGEEFNRIDDLLGVNVMTKDGMFLALQKDTDGHCIHRYSA